jgi:hypothetical protein
VGGSLKAGSWSYSLDPVVHRKLLTVCTMLGTASRTHGPVCTKLFTLCARDGKGIDTEVQTLHTLFFFIFFYFGGTRV